MGRVGNEGSGGKQEGYHAHDEVLFLGLAALATTPGAPRRKTKAAPANGETFLFALEG